MALKSTIFKAELQVKRLRRAAGRASRVAVYSYGRNAERWWTQYRAELERIANLSVFKLATAAARPRR